MHRLGTSEEAVECSRIAFQGFVAEAHEGRFLGRDVALSSALGDRDGLFENGDHIGLEVPRA